MKSALQRRIKMISNCLKVLLSLALPSLTWAQSGPLPQVGAEALYFGSYQKGEPVRVRTIFNDPKKNECLLLVQDQNGTEIKDFCETFAFEKVGAEQKSVMCYSGFGPIFVLGQIVQAFSQWNNPDSYYRIQTQQALSPVSTASAKDISSFKLSPLVSVRLLPASRCAEERKVPAPLWVYNTFLSVFDMNTGSAWSVTAEDWMGKKFAQYDLTGSYFQDKSRWLGSSVSLITDYVDVDQSSALTSNKVRMAPSAQESVELVFSPLYGQLVMDRYQPHIYGIVLRHFANGRVLIQTSQGFVTKHESELIMATKQNSH